MEENSNQQQQQGQTHYQILGVSPDATIHDIKQAFVSLARVHHPDRSHPHSTSTTTSDSQALSFHRIQTAWNCLQNTEKRQQYDQSLYIQRQQLLTKRRAAIPITIDDCIDSSDKAGNDDVMFYSCRCGHKLDVQDEVHDLLECTACSLVYDTRALFDEP